MTAVKVENCDCARIIVVGNGTCSGTRSDIVVVSNGSYKASFAAQLVFPGDTPMYLDEAAGIKICAASREMIFLDVFM